MLFVLLYCGGEMLLREGTYEGMHTQKVQVGLKDGYGFVYCFRGDVFFCIFLGLFSF